MEQHQSQLQQNQTYTKQAAKPPKKKLSIEEQIKLKKERKDVLTSANEKLKEQIKELKESYNGIMKTKPAFRTQITPEVQQLQKEIDQSTILIHKYKNQVIHKRRLIQSTSEQKVVDLENKVKELKNIQEELESEKKSLLIIEKQQQQALGNEHDTTEFDQRIQNLEEELKNQKKLYKTLSKNSQKEEKQMKSQHQVFIDLEVKVKRLTKLKQQQQQQDYDLSDIHDCTQIEKAIEDLKEKIKGEEKQAKKNVQTIEQKIREARHELDILQVQIREKDQNQRLYELKIRELKRSLKINHQQRTKEMNKEMDISAQEILNINRMNNSQDISFSKKIPYSTKKSSKVIVASTDTFAKDFDMIRSADKSPISQVKNHSNDFQEAKIVKQKSPQNQTEIVEDKSQEKNENDDKEQLVEEEKEQSLDKDLG